MAEKTLKESLDKIEHLHRAYLDIRENTPDIKRDGAECKAYHAWYDEAYVFFSAVDELQGLKDFKTFTEAMKDGNCFVLAHVYDSISASYKVLMKRAAEFDAQKKSTMEQTQTKNWPFETNDNHRRVFVSYSWDDDSHKEWVFRLCQDLRDKGVEPS